MLSKDGANWDVNVTSDLKKLGGMMTAVVDSLALPFNSLSLPTIQFSAIGLGTRMGNAHLAGRVRHRYNEARQAHCSLFLTDGSGLR